MAKKKDKEVSADKGLDENAGLDVALASIKKKHGVAVQWLDTVPKDPIQFIPTGSIGLDYALGGGLVRGRMVEIVGWEGCGKSTVAMGVIAEANKMGLNAAYHDIERALDPRLPIAYGVDPKKFLLEDSPISAEEHLEIMEALISSGNFGVCVLDSITALMPKVEMEGDIGDQHVGLQARLLSQACRKLVQLLGETNTLMIFINQFREKITTYGDPRTTPGGNAVKFYSTQRIEVEGTGKAKGKQILGPKGEVVGHKMGYKIIKNKVAAPFRTGEVDLIYGRGYDTTSELITIASDLALVESKGAGWYTYEDKVRVQGKDAFASVLKDSVELRTELETRVKELLGLGGQKSE